ncbi:HAD family hydrolase [Synechococcus sp. Tobar12-5m-g]|uniref:HAD family hydrolase n=1 Tax=unclassified Synechococcus TaxID=2626047 RepID=UPI0020CD6DD4|nr:MULTISPECIES: HAD family hydrolase [unclassified Synechococcus]MCP9773005.1 HAD family hydrolase [Synechococcus sp. Tobar12-5m-g]MCP9873846.1 HAD family hydrolase [Synechococcus sp. Cruz CV-v-12]
MSSGPLLVFDFDGVLVDGMAEYWWSSRQAVHRLDPALVVSELAPEAFARLRPRIHQGWEMVLVAAELARPGGEGAALEADYAGTLGRALARSGWQPQSLQAVLEEVRREAIATDRLGWLALHRPYPGVPERLRSLAAEGADWAVLTTKGAAFAAELLAAAALKPLLLFGHEQGSKPTVLLKLRELQRPLWFIEDRRPTLETVRATPGLESVRCFLAAWGYLGPEDRLGLPAGIALLEPDGFGAPLAIWP